MNADTDKKIPLPLMVVAALCLLGGISALSEVIVAVCANEQMPVKLNFGILGFPACFGLLRLREAWRILVLVMVWVMLVLTPFMVIFSLSASGPITLTVFGYHAETFPHARFFARLLMIFMGAAIFAVNFWIYKILTRAEVKKLFAMPC